MEEYKNFRPDDPTRKTKALLQYVPLPQPGTPQAWHSPRRLKGLLPATGSHPSICSVNPSPEPPVCWALS